MLVAMLVLLAAPMARAEDARIAAARKAYDNLEQAHAIEVLDGALSTTLSDHDRAAALRLKGASQMVLRQREAAIAAFIASFALEPDAALEPQIAVSPDARSLFEVARGQWLADLVPQMEAHAADIAKLQLHVTAPAVAHGGDAIAIHVDVVDPAALAARVELSYRRRGNGEFTLLTRRLVAPRALAFTIPAAETESPRPFTLEYHVVARHRTGFDLRRYGDADHPHAISVTAGHVPRWHELWWVRGVIAAGVIGLGAGGYLFYRSLDVGGQDVVIGRR